MEAGVNKQLSHMITVGLFIIFTIASLGTSAQAAELCGLWSESDKNGKELARFRMLKEFSGKAFIDMESCLVWQLDVVTEPETLDYARERCDSYGQGGPHGHMGWRLPTAAELTSLDITEEAYRSLREADSFKKLPPFVRIETPMWTSTPWRSEPDTLTAVTFSARTTIVHPIKQDQRAGVWCVRCCAAAGLQ